jgi:antitoxin component YwqK of YwqJK toxin-antitoxin module
MNDKDITPYNNKHQRHGLWCAYFADGKLWHKSFYQNGIKVGYEEDYSYNTKLSRKKYNL